MEGQPIKLVCSFNDTPNPTIEWFKGKAPVKESRRVKIDRDDTSTTLTIKEARSDDVGEYKCVVRNDLGSASTTTKIKVIIPKKPDFKVKLRRLDVTEGEQARLTVKVDALPKPDIQWYCGTTKIQEGGRFEIVEEADVDLYTLVINDIKRDDAATYKCEAINEAGKSTCRGEVVVKERQYLPEFTSDELDTSLTVRQGDELKIDMTIKANPKPDVKWYKDGKPLRDTTKMDVRSRGDNYSITIYSSKPEDAGHYKCEARNQLGAADRSFEVKVEGAFYSSISHLYHYHTCLAIFSNFFFFFIFYIFPGGATLFSK